MGFLHDILYRPPKGGGGGGLGRKEPTDWSHVEKYPLSDLAAADQPAGIPVVIGINWYTDFDNPTQDSSGRWWVAKKGIKGTVRGGHCVCVKSGYQSDSYTWWSWYNQGNEGACVGFGSTRCMTLLNRLKYDPRWLWDMAKKADGFPDTNPGDDNGTTVRAAMGVLRAKGHVPWSSGYKDATWQVRDQEVPVLSAGISAYRWATTIDQVRSTLNTPLHDTLQAVPFLNSWGRQYPHVTWMPYTVLERLISENGEVALVTDR